jgi:hypothetical protein
MLSKGPSLLSINTRCVNNNQAHRQWQETLVAVPDLEATQAMNAEATQVIIQTTMSIGPNRYIWGVINSGLTDTGYNNFQTAWTPP